MELVEPFAIDMSKSGTGLSIRRRTATSSIVSQEAYASKNDAGWTTIAVHVVNLGDGNVVTFYDMQPPSK